MARKLASIVEIESCEPIPDTERLSVATMKGKGWKVVTGRDEFKPGDLCVFFEIDAALNPADERYAFLRDRCLRKFVSKGGNVLREVIRIKTCKLRGVVSQGLLMPIGKFPELNPLLNGKYPAGEWSVREFRMSENGMVSEIHLREAVPDGNGKRRLFAIERTRILDWPNPEHPHPTHLEGLVGEDVTELLHVEHYDEVKEQLQPQTGNAISADAMGSFPSAFVPKTDEDRIQNLGDWFEKMKGRKWQVSVKADGCVLGSTFVETSTGPVKINNIVTNKTPALVLTFNEETRRCEYRKIVAWHKYPITKPMVRIKYSRCESDNVNSRTKGLTLTSDHLVFTDKGWIQACSLKNGDVVYKNKKDLSQVIKQMIVGCLLGDSCVNNNSVHFSHSEKQRDYLEAKARLLGDLWIDSGTVTSGYGSKMVRGHTVVNAVVLDAISAPLEKYFTPIAVAFWLMDDGSLCIPEGDTQSPYFRFYTQGHDDATIDELLRLLEKRFGIHATTNICTKTKKRYIRISADDTDRLSAFIAPFVVPSMKYKLPKKYRDVPYVLDFYGKCDGDILIPYHILSVEDFDPKTAVVKSGRKTGQRMYSFVFDIEVEGNHNYFGNGILVHNSSCTIAYSPSIDAENPFIVCSRNLRLKRETAAGSVPVYWQMAEKFGLPEKLKSCHDEEGRELAIQGEIVGPGIQNDRNKENEYIFKCFRIWDIANQKFLNPNDTVAFCKEFDIPHVEVVKTDFPFFDEITTMEDALKFAEGPTAEGNEREGVVLKTCDDGPYYSCKIINNKYLLKQND